MTKGFVSVDVSSRLQFKKRVAQGDYMWVNPLITEDRFPVSIKSDYRANLVIFRFDKQLVSQAVIALIEREKCRAARIEELLALGGAYKDIQEKGPPIAALGSSYKNQNDLKLLSPVLSGVDGQRQLGLVRYDESWPALYRFLGVQ